MAQRHPAGLYVLFFTELWERFSYYGMRALLVLYMVNYFKWTQTDASFVYKWYTSLVYLTPLIGGYLADRYLGNKKAVIIGASLMAIGHFLMAFEEFPIFFAALVFLIAGNGFFKPNMSTQVGRLYPPNDGRRDAAYTIFYMGINMGAFLAPLVCGWLANNTKGGYHSGFAAAGFGMVLGLLIYLFGVRWVIELDQTGRTPPPTETPRPEEAAGSPIESGQPSTPSTATPTALTEAVAERTPTAIPFIYQKAPLFMMCLGAFLAIGSPLLATVGIIEWNTVVALELGAICSFIAAWIVSKVENAMRDRVVAIYALGFFVICFWGGFEQAGNVLNLWADQATDRFLTEPAEPPELYPGIPKEDPAKAAAEKESTITRLLTMYTPIEKAKEAAAEDSKSWWSKLWNPVSTEWFQSINALAIFLIAPFFAIMWTWLDRRGRNPSIPTKMAIGLVFLAISFVCMVGSGMQEDKQTIVKLEAGQKLPEAIKLNAANQLCHADGDSLKPYHSGRLTLDSATNALHLQGVFPDVERDRMVRSTAPAAYKKKVEELHKLSNEAKERDFKVEVQLDETPPGFDLQYAGIKKSEVDYDLATKTLRATIHLNDQQVKALLLAGGDPQFRKTMNEVMIESSKFRVSPWWLFWCYIFATLGELCLSPIGLSMVSKLAPARFATMLMGIWLLMSFFGNYLAGAMGELYSSFTPTQFYWGFVVGLGIAALVLFLIARKIVTMMHGVN